MNILSRLLSLCLKSSDAPGTRPPVEASAGPAATSTPGVAAGHPGYHPTSWLLRECVRHIHPSLPMLAAELRDRACEFEAIGD